MPGVNQITTGSGISKPVIRGLSHNQVLVINDGVRQEGQQWGDEHGIEIDARSVHSIEVLKGPASLMYGSDAMGGVILMHSAPILPEGTMQGEAAAEFQSNNGLLGGTLNWRGNKHGFLWDARWSGKWAHDYHSPQDGYVGGTAFREQAASAMLGYADSQILSKLLLSYYHMKPGMTEVGHHGYTPGNAGYSITLPYQHVAHYKAVLDNSFNISSGKLIATIGYQQNRRREFEHSEECELDMRLHTLTYDFRYIFPSISSWKFNIGAGGMWQQSTNLGEEFLIPDYKLFDIGVFATASRSFFDVLHISGGLRFDYRHLHSTPPADDAEMRFTDFTRDFNAVSGSIGAIYNVSPALDLKLNVSRGYRTPSINELASNGEHEGTFRYEIGNATLKAEESLQADLGLDFTSEYVSGALSLFANRIDNYIYLARNGEAEDNSPVYTYNAGDAFLMGGEARLILHLLHHLHFENAFSYVSARQLHASADTKYLPFTPAPRLLSTLHYDFSLPFHGSHDNTFACFAELEMDLNLRQSHVYLAGDTETPTPSYTLFNLSVGTDIFLADKRKLCSITLSGTNIFNRSYQSHLSRFKYAGTYPFTGHYGFDNPGANICIKVLFPLYF